MTETANTTFSILRAYDTLLGTTEPHFIESPQVQEVPFHSLTQEFLNQQPLSDLLSTKRALVRLKTIIHKSLQGPLNEAIQKVDEAARQSSPPGRSGKREL